MENLSIEKTIKVNCELNAKQWNISALHLPGFDQENIADFLNIAITAMVNAGKDRKSTEDKLSTIIRYLYTENLGVTAKTYQTLFNVLNEVYL